MTFYLKYRPQTIEELDLENVRDTLQKIVKSENIPHAFLFAGPKGTGKTSAARILAKVINCEDPIEKGVPCNKCKTCTAITKGEHIDVIEMDAASHRGIDDIRLLKDAVKLSPARANKKVYIIDEAHMLTTEASNALLKTLEEPPDHVVFIMATTNPEKLIGTIRSRTTTVQFQKAAKSEILNSLKKVIKDEKIKADEESLEMIVDISDGSFRDAQKMLEQLSTEMDSLDAERVREFLYGKNTYDVDKFIDLLVKKDTKEALEVIEIVSANASIKFYTEQMVSRLRKALLAKFNSGDGDIKRLSAAEISVLIKLFSKAFSEMSYYPIEQLPVELAVVEWCGDAEEMTSVDEERSAKRSNKDSNSEDKNESKDTKQAEASNGEVVKTAEVKKVTFSAKLPDGIDENVWTNVLTKIRPRNASTEALLRAARPIEFDGKTLNIGVYYKFHKEKLEGTPHRDLLESVLEGVLGNDVRIVCTLTEPPAKQQPQQKEDVVLTESDDEDIIKVAEEIFGS